MTPPLLPVAWTLCYEMLFYICAAVALVDRRLGYVLLAAYAACLALRSFGPIFQFLGNPLVIEFLIGVAIAKLPAWRPGLTALPAGFALLIILASTRSSPISIEVIDFLTGDASVQRLLEFGLPSALIVYGTMQIKAQRSVWTYLGEASYSIYLVHLTIITGLIAVWKSVSVPPDVIVALGVTLSLVVSWRVHELIERPLLRTLPREL